MHEEQTNAIEAAAKARRNDTASRLAGLTLRHWEITQELEGINRQIQYLSGVSQEGQVAGREAESVKACMLSQAAKIKELEGTQPTSEEQEHEHENTDKRGQG